MEDSTIAALATPAGRGGIGIIKISGPQAVSIAKVIFRPGRKSSGLKDVKTHRLYYGRIVDPQNGRALDEVLLSVMKAGYSYTREDVVEINSHGGPVVVNAILGLVLGSGARLAEPGEFTKRAFLNGRIDLTQAEGVMDLINARSRKALELAAAQIDGALRQRIEAVREFLVEIRVRLEAAIDFPEDVSDVLDTRDTVEQIQRLAVQPLVGMIRGYQTGRMFREGAKLAIVGRPNVGKSSLLNRLVERQRAIVTDIAGTTRDVVEASVQIKGVPVNLMDTAGYHQTCELVEQIGIEKTKECIYESDAVVLIVEANRLLSSDDRELYEMIRTKPHVVAANKSDIAESSAVREIFGSFGNCRQPLLISALHNQGIDKLKEVIFDLVGGDGGIELEDCVVPNLRQQALLEKSLEAVNSSLESVRNHAPYECVCIDLEEAVQTLGSILGMDARVDILDRIFSQFCIGK